jgi:hypothetical protein
VPQDHTRIKDRQSAAITDKASRKVKVINEGAIGHTDASMVKESLRYRVA